MWIDGVFSGGGIKGFALIGAIQAIEEKGFRFKRVAGTSAGSIIAAFTAAGFSSEEMIHLLNETDVKGFLDIRRPLLPLPFARWLLIYWRLGVFRGNKLELWLEEKLAQKGIYTFSDLPKDSLRVIASDLTNGKLMVLPDDLERYGIPPDSFPVARAIRMSCSIPYFFEPVRLKGLGGTSIVVDGGVLSNFPMWLFDKENVKNVRPVLGIKLSPEGSMAEANKIKNGVQMFGALFETMKDAHDSRYISRKHAKNIIFIPVENIQATSFEVTEQRKNALVELGRLKANEFFKKWCY
ncbi:patatin-like phospholipase family protein [Falsibacillus pallidus]|uniref:NTE family protein n=1 Tax=Falsibacillus pallidus TaxID=493781 RepID=A0A370GBU7_9BACI|nr:patatin-like phospholipase family protein [Falsibacillus pallidus]RDI41177.1 NTE family protein [Falsibacillus pallidus]